MEEGRIETATIGPTRVAFVSLTGPYEDWGKGLMELKEWIDEKAVTIKGQPRACSMTIPLNLSQKSFAAMLASL